MRCAQSFTIMASTSCKRCTCLFEFLQCVMVIYVVLSPSYFPQASEVLSSTFVAHHERINFDPCTQCTDFAHLLLVFLTTGSELNVCPFLLLEFDSYANELDSHGFFSLLCRRYHPQNSFPPPSRFLSFFVSLMLPCFLSFSGSQPRSE